MPRKLATAARIVLIPRLLRLALLPSLALLAPLAPLLTLACDRPGQASRSAAAPAAAVATPPPAPALQAPPSPGRPLVVFLGDSLTAGLGLAADQAYPAVLDRRLHQDGVAARVLNAGVSGDTTAGGVRRLPWLLAQHPAVVVIGLGANDGLRGNPVPEIESNLDRLVATAQQAGAQVLLLGMVMPPNYGPDYTSAFAAVYPHVAARHHAALVPFLLAGVGGVADLNQADGIHPTAPGQLKVAANVLPYLEELLRHPAAPPAAH